MGFWKNLENSAPFLRISLSIFDIRRFPEEAPELPVNFISLSISAQASEVFLPPDILGGIHVFRQVYGI